MPAFAPPRIEQLALASLKPDPRNARRHSQKNLDAVRRSLQRFGQQKPIVVDRDGKIVAGHCTVDAARAIGWETIAAVRTDLDADEARAYAIADNRTAELATWDDDRLAIELAEIAALNIDMLDVGFDAEALASLLPDDPKDGNTDPDDCPAPPDEATTRLGDLWLLGNHRLLCGDSSKPEDVDRLLDGQPIHLVNTDPPYNVKVEPRSNNAIAAGLSSFAPTPATHHQSMDVARHPGKAKATHRKLRPKDRPLANDFVSEEAFDGLLDAWFGNMARVLEPGRGFYIWGGYANLGNYPPFLKKHALYFSQSIVWDKQHPVLTRKDFMGAFELCFYGWREGAAHVFLGPNNVTDLWHVKKVNPQSMIHLTEKPVELAVRAMQYSSRQGEHVLDLFGGSGSTLIAAEQTGRKARLVELDPLYCDVIVQRWERFTGGKAERVAAGA